jgi:hypothetical protein
MSVAPLYCVIAMLWHPKKGIQIATSLSTLPHFFVIAKKICVQNKKALFALH